MSSSGQGLSRAYTIMGHSAFCENDECQRQVHTKGMIGGGWRVDGKGGPELILDIQTHPGRGLDNSIDNPKIRIVIDREARIVEVTQQ